MARRVLISEVSGRAGTGQTRFGWVDGVKVTLGTRGMMVKWEWRALVHMLMIEFHKAIFTRFLRSFGPLPALWWFITWRGVGCRYTMR